MTTPLNPIDRNAAFDPSAWVAAAEARGYTLLVLRCLATGKRYLRIMDPEDQRAPDDLELFYWKAGADEEERRRNQEAVKGYLEAIGKCEMVPLMVGTVAEHDVARRAVGGAQ